MFPIDLTAVVQTHNGNLERRVVLRKPLTVLLGPNGSGKTHLLRALKDSLAQRVAGKGVRFLSAGRMGTLEQWRSDSDGIRGGRPDYESANYGGKKVQQRRHQIETLIGDFQTMALRADILVKVQERLRKLFRREVFLDWDSGNLKVAFSRTDQAGAPYSSGREASGLMHLVGILAALYDDEVGALLIDEPEVSLHPQLQAFLLNEMLSVAGMPSSAGNKKILVIATHSTELIQVAKASDLLSLVFCLDLDRDPLQIPDDAPELANRKLQGLISRLGQEHKLALFSRRPLLVEGPSDVLICSAIASKLDVHLEAAGSQLLPVIGKGQIPVVVKLFRLLGKAPVVLADADALADGLDLVGQFFAGSTSADAEAAELGFSSAMEMARTIYRDFIALVNSGAYESIRVAAERHPYWTNSPTDLEQAKRRAAFCVLFNPASSSLDDIDPEGRWQSIRARLASLMTLLERCGCFILRSGSVESYYRPASSSDSGDKVSAAAGEAEAISLMSANDVRTGYADIVRCVSFAAASDPISEPRAIKELLLSIAAPALAKLQEGGSEADIQALSRRILGDRAGIFGLQVEDGALLISLQSPVLTVPGLPITLRVGDDLFKRVNDAVEID